MTLVTGTAAVYGPTAWPKLRSLAGESENGRNFLTAELAVKGGSIN
ncbi:MAG: hypothetical protein U0805_03780 [Pirellulales bacterium]